MPTSWRVHVGSLALNFDCDDGLSKLLSKQPLRGTRNSCARYRHHTGGPQKGPSQAQPSSAWRRQKCSCTTGCLSSLSAFFGVSTLPFWTGNFSERRWRRGNNRHSHNKGIPTADRHSWRKTLPRPPLFKTTISNNEQSLQRHPRSPQPKIQQPPQRTFTSSFRRAATPIKIVSVVGN
jgi:hypothetical protein